MFDCGELLLHVDVEAQKILEEAGWCVVRFFNDSTPRNNHFVAV